MAKCKEGYRKSGNKCVKTKPKEIIFSKRNYRVGGGGIGFTGLLTLIFITLKLTHVIDWSWWWILAPLWIPFALTVLFIIVMFIIFAIILKRW